jgi:hypothetical protein
MELLLIRGIRHILKALPMVRLLPTSSITVTHHNRNTLDRGNTTRRAVLTAGPRILPLNMAMAVNNSTDMITEAAHHILPTKTNTSKAVTGSQTTNNSSISTAIHSSSTDTPALVRPVNPVRMIVA